MTLTMSLRSASGSRQQSKAETPALPVGWAGVAAGLAARRLMMARLTERGERHDRIRHIRAWLTGWHGRLGGKPRGCWLARFAGLGGILGGGNRRERCFLGMGVRMTRMDARSRDRLERYLAALKRWGDSAHWWAPLKLRLQAEARAAREQDKKPSGGRAAETAGKGE